MLLDALFIRDDFLADDNAAETLNKICSLARLNGRWNCMWLDTSPVSWTRCYRCMQKLLAGVKSDTVTNTFAILGCRVHTFQVEALTLALVLVLIFVLAVGLPNLPRRPDPFSCCREKAKLDTLPAVCLRWLPALPISDFIFDIAMEQGLMKLLLCLSSNPSLGCWGHLVCLSGYPRKCSHLTAKVSNRGFTTSRWSYLPGWRSPSAPPWERVLFWLDSSREICLGEQGMFAH